MPQTDLKNNELVGVIILHYKAWKETIATLKSVLNSNYQNHKVLIVDNDNNPKIITNLEQKFDLKKLTNFEIIQTKKNLGFAGGHNFGIRYLQKKYHDIKYFWLLNNDLEVDPLALKYLVEYAQKNSKKALIGSKIFDFNERNKLIAYGGRYRKWTGRAIAIGKNEIDKAQFDNSKVDYPQGAAMLISQNGIKKAGLMREDLFLFYEEISWSETIRKNGLKVGVCSEAKIYHHESKTAGKESNLSFYYSFRNSMIIARDYWFYTLPTVFIYHSIRSLYKSKLDLNKLKAFWSGFWGFLINK
jgi:GT2 family glycosyltransferase